MNYGELWLHLLNAELDQRERSRLEQQLRRVLGPGAPRLSGDFFQEYQPFLHTMREAWARLRGLGADTAELAPVVEAAGPEATGLFLDGLLAPGVGVPPDTSHTLSTQVVRAALFGFSAYVHNQAYAEEPVIVDRCAGVYPVRGTLALWDLGTTFPYFADPDLTEQQLGHSVSAPLGHCGKLFVRVGRGDFCSKACRDRTFALARRQRHPRYDADKQKRYRERLKLAQGLAAPPQ